MLEAGLCSPKSTGLWLGKRRFGWTPEFLFPPTPVRVHSFFRSCGTLLRAFLRMWVTLLTFNFPGSLLHAQPADLSDYAFIQRPGARLPIDKIVTDERGQVKPLNAFFGSRPVILVLGYFHCPNLCSVVRDDLLAALKQSGLKPNDYTLLMVSIDPAETTAEAAAALADDKSRYAGDQSDAAWHFVTGDAQTIAQIEQTVGFKSRYDAHLRQFLHPAGSVILTADGTVSGYLLGVGYQGGDLRTAVFLAKSGAYAAAALPVLLLCFHYDASSGRYTFAVMKTLRLAGVLTIATIAGLVILLRRRKRAI